MLQSSPDLWALHSYTQYDIKRPYELVIAKP